MLIKTKNREVSYCNNGPQRWFINYEYLHREDGPAYILESGCRQEWYLNDKLHREDGPAIITTVAEWYYLNDKCMKILKVLK